MTSSASPILQIDVMLQLLSLAFWLMGLSSLFLVPFERWRHGYLLVSVSAAVNMASHSAMASCAPDGQRSYSMTSIASLCRGINTVKFSLKPSVICYDRC